MEHQTSFTALAERQANLDNTLRIFREHSRNLPCSMTSVVPEAEVLPLETVTALAAVHGYRVDSYTQDEQIRHGHRKVSYKLVPLVPDKAN